MVKEFLLLIIIMKSSEILTNFVDKMRHNLLSELENGKITRTPSLFVPSIYFQLFFYIRVATNIRAYTGTGQIQVKTRIHSSYAKLSRGVRVKDPTTDLIFLRKTFLKPLYRVFCFIFFCRRLKPCFSLPGFVWIGPKSITYFCKYSNLCEWEALFTISALQR